MDPVVRQHLYKNQNNTYTRVFRIIFEFNEDPTGKDFDLTLSFVDAERIEQYDESSQARIQKERIEGQYEWVFFFTEDTEPIYTAVIKVTFLIEETRILTEEPCTPLNLTTQGDAPTEREANLLNYTFRPGYINPDDQYLYPASAPGILNFVGSSTRLCEENNEDTFRAAIVETLLKLKVEGEEPGNVAILGANRARGPARADAYCDMVSWDANYRYGVRTSNSNSYSSCGLLIRNIWWLCGARGTDLLDKKYTGNPNVLGFNGLLAFPTRAIVEENNAKFPEKFFPKVGDAIHMENSSARHIFTICEVLGEKTIGFTEDGEKTIVKNSDGTIATSISFLTIEGGQEDGGTYGCHGIKQKTRTIQLTEGHFNTRYFDGESRPFSNWIDIWKAKDKFTATRIIPQRISSGRTDI